MGYLRYQEKWIGDNMKVAFIVLMTDKYEEGAQEEIDRIRKEILSKSTYWCLKKVTVLSEESLNDDFPVETSLNYP